MSKNLKTTLKTAFVRLRCFALIAFLTVIQYHALSMAHGNMYRGNWAATGQLSEHIANGTFGWMHVAHRVLLPKAMKLVANVLDVSMTKVWFPTLFLMLLGVNVLVYATLSWFAATKPYAALFAVAYGAGFVLMQEPAVLPPYDLVDLVVWFLFALGMFQNRGLIWFAVLFAVELHNREVAIFIPFWVALTYLLPLTKDWRRWVTGLSAAACVPLGLAYMHWLRLKMLTIPFDNKPGTFHGEVMTWKFNIHALKECWFGTPWTTTWMNHTRYEIWVAIAAMALTVLCVSYLRGWFAVRVAALLAGFWAMVFIAVFLMEIRAYYCTAAILMFCVLARGPMERKLCNT